MRPWACLGVILHTESIRTENSHALIRIVVQIYVGNFGLARQRIGINTEIMILTGDLD
jgi:hypothetical protein